MTNIQEILIAIRNGDFDHIDDMRVELAKQELMVLLECDRWDLGQLLRELLTLKVETRITFHDTGVTHNLRYDNRELPVWGE